MLLAMGMDAVKLLASANIIPKNRAVTSLRMRPFKMATGAHALVTYSPSIAEIDYSKAIDMQCDVRAACRWIRTGSYAPKVGNYRYVKDFSEAVAWIIAQYKKTGKKVDVSFDTETLGLDPYALEGYIESVQVTYKAGTADVIRFRNADNCKRVWDSIGDGLKGLYHQIKWLLTSDWINLRMGNGKYDMQWLWKMWEIECFNFNFDTTLVGSLLDENRSNSLTVHAKVCTDMGGYDDAFNAKYDKSRMDLVPDDDFLIYAGGDTDACYQTAEVMKPALMKDGKLTNFYINILHPAARAYETVERTGWCVDTEYYRHLRDEIETEIDGYVTKAKEVLGGRLVAKHTDRKDGTLNLTKASLLVDFFFSPTGLNLKPKMWTAGGKDGTKEKKPATAMEHILMFKDHPRAAPLVAVLSDYASADKTLGTYVYGFLKHLREDGRWHPNFFMFKGMDEVETEGGATTGRLSVKDPAIQTVPKHTKWAKKLRRAIIAPPGHVIVGNDYSQGELKITACLANEPVMLDAYLKGIDLHAITAARLKSMTLEDFLALAESDPDKYEFLRFLAKASNFGLVYGQQAPGYRNYAEANYGVAMSDEEAQENRNAFFGLYTRLLPWHEETIRSAHLQGYMRSPLGRLRRLPLIHSRDWGIRSKQERRAINAPVQSTLSDMALWATSIMHKQGQLEKAPVFGMIHDQLLSYVPEDSWEKIAKQRKEVMENLPFNVVNWKPQLRFTVDTEMGLNLGDMMKLKEAA